MHVGWGELVELINTYLYFCVFFTALNDIIFYRYYGLCYHSKLNHVSPKDDKSVTVIDTQKA